MRVSVLGAAEARIAGAPVDLGTRKQRALLAALALHLPAEHLDAACFDRVVGTTRQRLSALAPAPALVPVGGAPVPAAADLELIVADLDSALALWRGTPYSELEDAPAASAERFRLEELRLVALEDRAVAGLALGLQFSWVVPPNAPALAITAPATRTQAQIVRQGWAAADPPSR